LGGSACFGGITSRCASADCRADSPSSSIARFSASTPHCAEGNSTSFNVRSGGASQVREDDWEGNFFITF
jgi:hypothetical protein